MEYLKYTIDITNTKVNIPMTYKEVPPKFIVDVLLKSHAKKMGPLEYVKSKGIEKNSKIWQVIQACFAEYDLFWKPYNKTTKSLIEGLIKDGYITRTRELSGVVKSYLPQIDLFIFEAHGQKFVLKDQKELFEKATQIGEKLFPEALDLSASKVQELSIDEEREEITLKFEVNKISLFDNEISINNIKWNDLLQQNKLLILDGVLNNTELPNGFKFVTSEQWNQLEDWITIEDYDSQFIYKFKIKENNIEWKKIGSWNLIGYESSKVIREENFNVDTMEYKLLENYYTSTAHAEMNSFIYKKFILNSFSARMLIMKNIPLYERLLEDKSLLTTILLRDEDFGLSKVKLNPKKLTKILIVASNVKLPILINKISIRTRSEMLDTKLLNKINNVNPSLLTKEQFELIKDEERKQAAINDEYTSIVGKITTMGTREKIKGLTNKQKKQYIIDKRFVNWLNEKIGHNKGQKNITQGELSEARTNLEKARKINKL